MAIWLFSILRYAYLSGYSDVIRVGRDLVFWIKKVKYTYILMCSIKFCSHLSARKTSVTNTICLTFYQRYISIVECFSTGSDQYKLMYALATPTNHSHSKPQSIPKIHERSFRFWRRGVKKVNKMHTSSIFVSSSFSEMRLWKK